MKETLHFEILIHAPAKKVWETMLSKETYQEWTKSFDPTSTYEGSWEKGSRIKFVSTNGGGNGMLANIAESLPYTFVSIQHVGEIKDGVEDTTSESVKTWAGAFENYTFTEKGPDTLLAVDLEMQSTPEAKAMKEVFAGMWPNALAALKEICER